MIDYVSMSLKRWIRNDYKLNSVLSFIKLESRNSSIKRSKR